MATILIIDDDASVATVLEEALIRAGHRAIVCRDGRKVLDEVKEQAVDLLITDLFMDSPDGMEIIPKVRANYPQIKIIAISGGTTLTDQDYLPIARRLGAHATFHKPIELQQLLETIARLVPE